MLAWGLIGNNSGEATNPLSNNLHEAMRGTIRDVTARNSWRISKLPFARRRKLPYLTITP
jgi:hypothetical protein